MRKLSEVVRGCSYDEEELKELLNQTAMTPPLSLVSFYSKNSGQVFEECQFFNYRIAGWFNIKLGQCKHEQLSMSFQEVFNHSRHFVPNNLMPFAYNDMNDFFLISDTDKVYFLRNDMAYDEQGALLQIAESFEEFINELCV